MIRMVRIGFVLTWGLLIATLAMGCTRSKGSYGGGLPKISASSEVLALERQMFARVNKDRAKKGLPALEYDDELAEVGRYHSHDMKTNDFFGHVSPTTGNLEDRLDRAGYLAAEARENVASASDIDTAEDKLLASPGHHANIMARGVTHIGIGVVQEPGPQGMTVLWITQVFSKPAGNESPGEAEERVLRLVAAARKKAGARPLQSHSFLQKLANKYLGDLPDEPSASALARIGKSVSEELSKSQDHGLSTVAATSEHFMAGADFEVPQVARRPGSKHLGIAVGSAQDARGRPYIKVLMLIGR